MREALQRVLLCYWFEKNKNVIITSPFSLSDSYMISRFYVHSGESNVKNRLVSSVTKTNTSQIKALIWRLVFLVHLYFISPGPSDFDKVR
jgi:hypothetical protein